TGVEIAKRVFGDGEKVSQMLALGAGACRFPYELHRWLKPENTLCVDLNPLLLSLAQRLVRGESLELIEFPTVPPILERFAIKSKLSAPQLLGNEFEFLVHDLEEWAFAENSVDLVVTCWLIDVVSIAPRRLFSLINRVLKPNGRWLNYGPL